MYLTLSSSHTTVCTYVYGGFLKVGCEITSGSLALGYKKPCSKNQLLFIPIFSAGLLDKRHQPFPLNASGQHKVFSTFSFVRNLTIPMARLHCFSLKHLSRLGSHPSIAMSLLLCHLKVVHPTLHNDF
jgi:hypothetical protein